MTIASTVMNVTTMAVWTTSATILGVMAMSAVTRKPILAPVQAISHIVLGEQVVRARPINLMFVLIGFGLNACAMIGWSAVAEMLFQLHGRPPRVLWVSAVVSTLVTMLAYFVDFQVVPKRFTPGFEHVLSRRSLYLVYCGMALALCLGSLGRVA